MSLAMPDPGIARAVFEVKGWLVQEKRDNWNEGVHTMTMAGSISDWGPSLAPLALLATPPSSRYGSETEWAALIRWYLQSTDTHKRAALRRCDRGKVRGHVADWLPAGRHSEHKSTIGPS